MSLNMIRARQDNPGLSPEVQAFLEEDKDLDLQADEMLDFINMFNILDQERSRENRWNTFCKLDIEIKNNSAYTNEKKKRCRYILACQYANFVAIYKEEDFVKNNEQRQNHFSDAFGEESDLAQNKIIKLENHEYYVEKHYSGKHEDLDKKLIEAMNRMPQNDKITISDTWSCLSQVLTYLVIVAIFVLFCKSCIHV